jgi:hypothetical protein
MKKSVELEFNVFDLLQVRQLFAFQLKRVMFYK